jgi:hypothetical protein
MKTLSRLVAQFTSVIVAVLSCFDRVLFKGDLPITNGPALEGFVDSVLKIRRCDFMAFADPLGLLLAILDAENVRSGWRGRPSATIAGTPPVGRFRACGVCHPVVWIRHGTSAAKI